MTTSECQLHKLHPPSKQLLSLQVALYCDLHGHSRKHGAFMYGCEHGAAPQVRDCHVLIHYACCSLNLCNQSALLYGNETFVPYAWLGFFRVDVLTWVLR